MKKAKEMKRHQTLIPISREHHEILMLAQLLKEGAPPYRGMPKSHSDKLKHAEKEYQRLILPHLKRDVERLFPFLQSYHKFEAQLAALNILQEEIKELFDKVLRLESNEKNDLGLKLEKYVRTKERSLFQEVQNELKESEFQSLSNHLYQ